MECKYYDFYILYLYTSYTICNLHLYRSNQSSDQKDNRRKVQLYECMHVLYN